MRNQFCIEVIVFSLVVFTSQSCFSNPVISIEGQLNKMDDQPSWQIEIRNLDDGSAVPWLYDFKTPWAQWTVQPRTFNYQITASELRLKNKVLRNLCGIQSDALAGVSFQIRLEGNLSADSKTLRCKVMRFKN